MQGMPPVQYDVISLAGGLDQVTPILSLKAGVARRAANFECSITGGYTRIAGYERFDGRPNPSDANYTVLICSLTATVSVGNTIVGATSAATGKVILVSGSTLVVTRQTGEFVTSEQITVSAVIKGSITEIQGVSSDGLVDATYKALAADDYRADILAVPGSGSILGVAYYNGTVYAWRNNAGGTAAALYKSSAAGWAAVSLGFEMSFSNGVVEILDGVTLTGQSSGATAVVARTVVEDGSWGGTTLASGRLILTSSTGTFTVGENLRISTTVYAHAASVVTAITLAPDGRYECVIANFGGGTANYRIYGCDGENRAFEFDGTVFVPINSTMPVDTPNHIAFHKQHLFLSFGSSLQFSSIGEPYRWSAVFGAGELAMNAPITNLLPLPGDQSSGALGVYTRQDTSVLYGTSSANFALSTFNTGTGAIAYTAQNLDQVYVLDDRGVVTLGTTISFGNFLSAAITMNLRPFIQAHKDLATASLVQREKGQYRVFFSDANALYITVLNGKVLGSMPIQYAHAVTCCTEGESLTGATQAFFGSTDGKVYRLDAGTSFDGQDIPADINLVANHSRSPRIRKRYRKAMLEFTGDSYAEVTFGYDLSYRSSQIDQPVSKQYSSDLRASYWDTFSWDNFVWDGQEVSPSEVEVTGTAENIAIRLSSVSAILEPYTINNIILHYTPRRGLR